MSFFKLESSYSESPDNQSVMRHRLAINQLEK